MRDRLPLGRSRGGGRVLTVGRRRGVNAFKWTPVPQPADVHRCLAETRGEGNYRERQRKRRWERERGNIDQQWDSIKMLEQPPGPRCTKSCRRKWRRDALIIVSLSHTCFHSDLPPLHHFIKPDASKQAIHSLDKLCDTRYKRNWALGRWWTSGSGCAWIKFNNI